MKISEVCNYSYIDTIEKLEKSCFPKNYWTRLMIKSAIDAQYRHVFVLSKNNEIVGYAIMQIIDAEGEVERIGVHPQYRGQSFAKKLLLYILDNLDSCFLEVSARNHVAYSLYCICGFEEIGKRRSYYQDGADAIMMKWKKATDE